VPLAGRAVPRRGRPGGGGGSANSSRGAGALTGEEESGIWPAAFAALPGAQTAPTKGAAGPPPSPPSEGSKDLLCNGRSRVARPESAKGVREPTRLPAHALPRLRACHPTRPSNNRSLDRALGGLRAAAVIASAFAARGRPGVGCPPPAAG